jgi:hypothetical protein
VESTRRFGQSLQKQGKFMHQANTSLTVRRSSRVPRSIPLLVTTLDPTAHFSEVCETLVVSAHGCAMRSRVKLETGIRLRLRSRDGRDTTAQVVSCHPIGGDSQSWMLAAKLERPDNFWGVPNCPKDWVVAALPELAAGRQPVLKTAAAAPTATSQPTAVAADPAVQQKSEELLRRMIAESVRPLQVEIVALKEKLQHKEANPSRFEVSLASIPPELEQQLQMRLRKELEPKVLDEARQQSSHLLAQAQADIQQKTKNTHEQFSRQLGDERRALEQQAKEISKRIAEITRERVDLGVSEFQEKLVEGGNQLKRLSHELLEFLQSSLDDELNARRGELQQLHVMLSAESSRMREQTNDLDARIAKLTDAVRSLESGLDQRLNQMCSRIVSETRHELENAAATVFAETTSRGSQALGRELDEVCEKIKAVQKEIIASASDSLDVQSRNAVRQFEQSMNDLAKASVERWRVKLAGGLSALAKNLDEQFQ